ncbi:hypothetical protein Cni_G27304 [Canna indica]|uniref:NAD-dependent epimerase/dehydratase domain-containing protein n=1 Tax=Canna indica TaxID=4628 RepID=A0AAQ3L0K2_9LILI|nr:hypothetical protein Cni_G27304 [Canna indica]
MVKVLLTGATGYLGNRLCHRLLAEGHAVRAFVRQSSDLSSLPPSHPALELAFGDVTDLPSLVDALQGCEVIFHVAALVEPWLPDPSRFFTVNVGGLKNVLQAFRETKTLKKIIYTSSFFALGPTNGYVADEKQLIERFNGRLPGYVGDGNDRESLSHVEDVVSGHVAAMHKGRLGERYLLTGENVSFVQVFDKAAVITKTRKPFFHIPLGVVEIYGWISVFFSRITGKLPLISYPTVRVLRHQWAYSCDKAKAELDYGPRSLNEGLSEVLLWLKESGTIKY